MIRSAPANPKCNRKCSDKQLHDKTNTRSNSKWILIFQIDIEQKLVINRLEASESTYLYRSSKLLLSYIPADRIIFPARRTEPRSDDHLVYCQHRYERNRHVQQSRLRSIHAECGRQWIRRHRRQYLLLVFKNIRQCRDDHKGGLAAVGKQ